MITLSNIRTEIHEDVTKLMCDFKWDEAANPFTESTMWFSIKNENADFFSTKVYDPFVLVSYYIAMHYGQNLKICGNVSKLLYKNLTNYVQRILQDFSDEMKPITFSVDGFDIPERDKKLIGTGISCGVDSFSTIYDRYVKEHDPDYRVNALFLFNCGTHGDFEDEKSHKLFEARYEQNKRAANELELPIFAIESNLHAFTHKIGEQKVGYFAIWSCILSMQKKICKYYVSSCLSYSEEFESRQQYHDFDMDAFCGIYLLPLIQTENIMLIYDGAQYKRSEKVENISDWSIAQKHLNVCVGTKERSENCSVCRKCLRTLFALEAVGKIGNFSNVFELEKYKKVRFSYLCQQIARYSKDAHARDNLELARKNGIVIPAKIVAYAYMIVYNAAYFAAKHLLGRKTQEKLKKIMRRS